MTKNGEPKVGDRVRFTDYVSRGWFFKPGETGTVRADRQSGESPTRYAIEVDGHGGRTGVVGLIHIEPIEAAEEPAAKRTPKVGDTVRILPGAIGVAREFIGRTVQISLAEGNRVRFECDGRNGTLLDCEWDFADQPPARVPAIKLRDGGYYLTRSDGTVGPMRRYEYDQAWWHLSEEDGRLWNDSGIPLRGPSEPHMILAEVPAPGAVPAAKSGDFVRVLPGATEEASRYIGRTVIISSVGEEGYEVSFEDAEGDEIALGVGEWERVEKWRAPRIGDEVRILPGATGTAEDYIGKVVTVSDVVDEGDALDVMSLYARDGDGEEYQIVCGEWEFADAAPLGPEYIDADAVADRLRELEPARRAPPRRPVVGDLLRVLPDASGSAASYIGETVEVSTVDSDGDPYFADWKRHDGEECLLVAGEWEFRGDHDQ